MLLMVLLVFLATTVLWVTVAWLLCWRVAHSLRDNSYATHVLVEQVLWPLLGGVRPVEQTPASPVVPATVNIAPEQ